MQYKIHIVFKRIIQNNNILLTLVMNEHLICNPIFHYDLLNVNYKLN